MKQIGKITHYNGRYGKIVSENSVVDFTKNDISFKQEVKVDDLVEFRLENKFPNITIARNISKILNK